MHVDADVRFGDRGGGRLPARDEGLQNVLRLERAVVHEDLADPARISQALLLGREHDGVWIEPPALDQRVEKPAADRPSRQAALLASATVAWCTGGAGTGAQARALRARMPRAPPAYGSTRTTRAPRREPDALERESWRRVSVPISCRVVLVALRAGLLDRGEDVANRVDQNEKRARDVRVQSDLPVPKLAQEIFAGVRDRLELGETEEAARALDRVDRPEHARELLGIERFLLEGHQVALDLAQALVALDQEFVNDAFVHRLLVPSAREPRHPGPRLIPRGSLCRRCHVRADRRGRRGGARRRGAISHAR